MIRVCIPIPTREHFHAGPSLPPVQWFLGDTLNLLGCLVQGMQLPTTTFLAMYFVVSDVVMLVQVRGTSRAVMPGCMNWVHELAIHVT